MSLSRLSDEYEPCCDECGQPAKVYDPVIGQWCPACAPSPAPNTESVEPNPWADAPIPVPDCGLPWTAHPTGNNGVPYCARHNCPARAAVPTGTAEKEQP